MKLGSMTQDRRVVSGAALAAVIVAAVFTGCGKKEMAPYGPGGAWVEDMRSRITEKITDPDKATQLIEQVDRIEMVLTDLDNELRGYYKKMEALDEDYNSTREEWQKEFDSFNEYRAGAVDKLIDITIEMRRIAGREDWEVISDMDETLYESWQRSLGS